MQIGSCELELVDRADRACICDSEKASRRTAHVDPRHHQDDINLAKGTRGPFSEASVVDSGIDTFQPFFRLFRKKNVLR
jgi:hypothetical protein